MQRRIEQAIRRFDIHHQPSILLPEGLINAVLLRSPVLGVVVHVAESREKRFLPVEQLQEGGHQLQPGKAPFVRIRSAPTAH
eukprot:scaffold7381_cov310-Pinguiococcus_pyrenoidosus.AAC.22